MLEEATFSQQERKSGSSFEMQVHRNTSGLFSLQPECQANKAEALKLSSQGLPELSQEGWGWGEGAERIIVIQSS